MGGLPHARFLRFTSLTRVKEVKNHLIKVRTLCSHNLNSSPLPLQRGVEGAAPYRLD